MQDEQIIIKRRKTIIIALFALVFVVASSVFIVNVLLNKSAIENLDSSKLDGIDKEDLRSIERSLKVMMKSNYNLEDSDINNLKLVVREDTVEVKRDSDNKTSWAHFLIDLNKPKLTYDVSFNSGASDAVFLCPDLSLMQDANEFCIGTDKQSTIDVALDKYLPYHDKTESGIFYSIWHGYDDSNSPRIEMYASICNNETKGAEVLRSIKDWIKDKGVNPDSIPINYQTTYCDHGEDD